MGVGQPRRGAIRLLELREVLDGDLGVGMMMDGGCGGTQPLIDARIEGFDGVFGHLNSTATGLKAAIIEVQKNGCLVEKIDDDCAEKLTFY